MTIEEVIKYCYKVAEINERQAKIDETPQFSLYSRAEELRNVADNHRQLAEWLKDYQRLQKAIENIKTEISDEKENQMKIGLECVNVEDKYTYLRMKQAYDIALDIIDKHISGKE